MLSRTGKRPAFGAIFLLNNISYFRTHVLTNPPNPALVTLFSKPTVELLNSNFRTARAAYFDANFSPLMQALTDEPTVKGSAGKAATKEKFTRFFDLLEEVAERHRMAKVLEDDKEARDTVTEEAVKLVVPALQKFTQKHKEKEFSKSEFLFKLARSPSDCLMYIRPSEMLVVSLMAGVSYLIDVYTQISRCHQTKSRRRSKASIDNVSPRGGEWMHSFGWATIQLIYLGGPAAVNQSSTRASILERQLETQAQSCRNEQVTVIAIMTIQRLVLVLQVLASVCS
jgi:hypothetical protein